MSGVNIIEMLEISFLLPPDHPVDDAGVGLDDLDYLGGDVLVGVGRDGKAEVTGAVHFHGGVHGLQEAALVNAGEDEAGLVKGLGALGAGADAHCRERMADAREEAALLRQSAAVADHCEGIHLETVVVVESERLMLDDTRVELKAALFQAFAGPRVA